MTETVLVTQNLTKKYGSVLALDHVSMTIERGQIYGLVGRNGAGKTTLIRAIASQTIPDMGAIALFGDDTAKGLEQARRRTGVMVETPSFFPFMTARENLEYYRLQRGIAGKHRADEALERVGLSGTGKKKFKDFSLGMKQRLGLGLAIMGNPDFLLLDEPVNGLDPMGIVDVRNMLIRLNQDKGTTILISSHILSELSSLATHYGFLNGGRLIEEISAEQLHDRCRECLLFTVGDSAKAAAVIEQVLGSTAYEILNGEQIRLYQFLEESNQVNRVLVENGIEVYAIETRGENLEDYFISLVGGGQHA